jgi:Holliday junction resolvase RusA-like endonuclease
MKYPVEFVVYGEPASKANQRKLVKNKNTGKNMFIKSQKALTYEQDFKRQCPQLDPPISEDVKVTMTIFYASRRPDLDESVILDCMQSVTVKHPTIKKKRVVVRNNIYLNDRQVKHKDIRWGLDRDNPRAEIKIELLEMA